MGNAAHLLGIVGRDWDTLAYEEAIHYLNWLDEYAKEQAKASSGK